MRIIRLSPSYKLVWGFNEKMHVKSLESCPVRRCILLEEFSNPFPNVQWQIDRSEGLDGVRAHSRWVVGLGFTFKPDWLKACAPLAAQQWPLATRDCSSQRWSEHGRLRALMKTKMAPDRTEKDRLQKPCNYLSLPEQFRNWRRWKHRGNLQLK